MIPKISLVKNPGSLNNPFLMDGNGDFQPDPMIPNKDLVHHPMDRTILIRGSFGYQVAPRVHESSEVLSDEVFTKMIFFTKLERQI